LGLNVNVQGMNLLYRYLLVGDDGVWFNDAATQVKPVDVCQDEGKVQLLFAWHSSALINHDWVIFTWFKTGLVSLRLTVILKAF
jgi:hypothetical protein